MRIRRLNMDTSWEINWGDQSFVIDPWLVGSEVDFFSWFNEQWHTVEPIHPSKINAPDFILISQSYSDHCHEETLQLFPTDIPILASPKAYKRLLKSFSKDRLIKLPLLAKDGFLKYGDLEIASIHPGNRLDPVYYAHVIKYNDKIIIYASHGFSFSKAQWQLLKSYQCELLIASSSHIILPKLLGGHVNPGLSNLQYLYNKLKPYHFINTHDEEKEHKGIVMKMAKCKYASHEELQNYFPNLLQLDNLISRELSNRHS